MNKVLKAIRKNQMGILLMIVSSICVCFGQLFWKLSNSGNYIYLLFGFGLYGIGALIMLIAYKYGSLSVLQPILSINYVITIILAKVVLNEAITPLKIIGIIVISLGVFFIGIGDD